MATSLISSEVDFDAPGNQHGFLRVPHSVHQSAYGWIGVPVVSIRGGDGPTALLIGGNHGDEYEAQVALGNLARTLRPEDVSGRLIILTMANAPAAQAGLRVSPVDDGNLNRSFPGDRLGTPTQMIAHYIEEVLMPQCDYAADLHSGGTSLYYPATLLRGKGHTPEETETLKTMQNAFDLPYAWVFTGGGGPNSTARTAMGAANRKGVVSVMAELGGGGAVSPDVLAQTERGLKRLLHALGMLPGYKPDQTRGTRELHAQGSIYAYDEGVFEPLLDIGDDVAEGQAVARIHFPDMPWRDPVIVTSPYNGMILCKRTLGRVQRGDALFQVAADA